MEDGSVNLQFAKSLPKIEVRGTTMVVSAHSMSCGLHSDANPTDSYTPT